MALDLGIDFSTISGQMVGHNIAAAAEFEREMISQRTKDALAIKRAQGVRLGRPRSLPDDVLRRVVKEWEEKRTLTTIAQGLNDDGVPTAHAKWHPGAQWWPATVRAVLASQDAAKVELSSD